MIWRRIPYMAKRSCQVLTGTGLILESNKKIPTPPRFFIVVHKSSSEMRVVPGSVVCKYLSLEYCPGIFLGDKGKFLVGDQRENGGDILSRA